MLVVVAATTLTTKATAINPTYSGSSITINEPANYVEVRETNNELQLINPFIQQSTTTGEIKLHVKVNDNETTSTATAEVEIYSLDGVDVLGPYTVTEGEDLVVDIDEREWSVSTLQTSQNSEVTYWVVE
ncbi:MAG: hypothetical protein DRJ10_00255 [Bacteroidetes bacterium]|nr:MAG: hypothetical protein DRJ10_00255 [Bacteroidota bacterium]